MQQKDIKNGNSKMAPFYGRGSTDQGHSATTRRQTVLLCLKYPNLIFYAFHNGKV